MSEAIMKRPRDLLDAKKTLHYKAMKDGGGIKQFLEFLDCSTADPRAGEFVKKWKKRRNKEMVLDDLAAQMGIDWPMIWSWAAEGACRHIDQAARFKQALAVGDVVGKNIEMSQKDKGYKDRNLFFQSTGIRPTASGTRINVNQSNVNTANAAAKSDTSLPNFDSQRREIAELARADE